MRMQSCEQCVEALKNARNACNSQLDGGALKELDRAIKILNEELERGGSEEEVERLKLRALQAMAALISILTNVRDWMT
jgi:hypothetical protein